jgi:hypothetical protein
MRCNNAQKNDKPESSAVDMMPEIAFLLLLLVANGSPILARRLLGDRFNRPLDGDAAFSDGRAVFGRSKTLRGFAVAVLATAAIAPLLSVTVPAGAIIGAFAMIGDLTSSFIKRRLGLAPGTRVMGLDQIPESLLPALVMMEFFDFDWGSLVLIVVVFLIIDVLISPLLYRLQLRRQR